MSGFPQQRLRRLRENPILRSMVAETTLSVKNLIYPLFAVPGTNIRREVSSMPGIFNQSPDRIAQEVRELADLGIPAVILFGIPEKKDDKASEAYVSNGIIQQTIRAIKKTGVSILIITDVCLCEYMSHGHCGIVVNDHIDNDASLELLAKVAVSHASEGADMVAPSDMMDGRVGRIRQELDARGLQMVPIMSYAAKYASAFYGPFRDAAQSAPAFGDRRSYQMHPGNMREAIREVSLDIEEGADIIMIKPALAYLDVVHTIKRRYAEPVAVYNVSGEYAMVKAAARCGWLDENAIRNEIVLSIRRAGADMILTYFARDLAEWLKHHNNLLI